jgi:membrane protein insertase Oxa1/YidC/SpoIIIJ
MMRRAPAGRVLSSAFASRAACRPAVITVSGFAGTQLRFAGGGTFFTNVLSTANWKPTRSTKAEQELREELPEIFETSQGAIEVDDYIRPDKTYFERLEDLWDWLFTFMSPVEKQMSWMRGLHESLDFSYGFIFLLWGVMMRLCTLPPMLYGHRNTLRMARCNTQVSEVTNNIKRINADKNLTTPERRVMVDGYRRMEKAIYKKNRCHKYGSFAAGMASPLLVTAFMAIRRLAAYEDDLESAQFLWIKDLTMPDPTMILPLLCTGLFITNFEMNQKLNRGGRSSLGLYMRWGIRVGALGFTYYFSSQPACLFAYWIGMSTAGMIQPMLLRNQRFREYFDFPPPPKSAIQHDEQSTFAWIKSKLTNQEIVKKAAEPTGPKFESINDQEVVLDDEDEKSLTRKAKK